MGHPQFISLYRQKMNIDFLLRFSSCASLWDVLQIISFSYLCYCFCAVAKKSLYRRLWRPASYNSKWDRTSIL